MKEESDRVVCELKVEQLSSFSGQEEVQKAWRRVKKNPYDVDLRFLSSTRDQKEGEDEEDEESKEWS